ncbi:hypothetical protein [Rathayibacter oskolensis]|uniref:hypothetical protein n=1 Tax=Rathayibacter oskolensis TaxID=1891671 RepID=UPI00101AD5F4|nr:hypothetical protein [Rathayibacter oskolensis]
MTRRIPLPGGLAAHAFTVAEARDSGLARNRLRRSDLSAPFHGVRAEAGPLDLRARAEALLTVLGPGSVLSHLTAARLWPLDLPHALPEEDLQ